MKNKRLLGFLLVVIGCFFWGIGGTVAQYLFQHTNITVDWLVSTRLIVGGLLLLTIQFLFKDRQQIITIWQTKSTALRLLIFSIVGMLFVQYTYMAAINAGNAAIATLLQYLAPVFIMLYLVFTRKAPFTSKDFVTINLALIGTFLLLTNGSLESFSVPTSAIVYGLLSAITLAFYTLYPIPLLKYFDSLVVVGWAMCIAGVIMSMKHAPWDINMSDWHLITWGLLFIVIIFGTALAYWFYVESLKLLSVKETSLLGNIEPLTSVFATVLWLKEPFGTWQWLGTTCIIIMMLYLALKKDKPIS